MRNKPSIVIRTALIILDLLLNTPSIYLSKNLDAFTNSIPILINTAPSPRLNMRTSRKPSSALPPAMVADNTASAAGQGTMPPIFQLLSIPLVLLSSYGYALQYEYDYF